MKCPSEFSPPPQHNHNRNHPAPNETGDSSREFAEFMWMGDQNLEEFDKQCEEELMEEMFIEMCFDELDQIQPQFDDMEAGWYYPPGSQNGNHGPSQRAPPTHIMPRPKPPQQPAGASQLNPLAPAFIPRGVCATNSNNSSSSDKLPSSQSSWEGPVQR